MTNDTDNIITYSLMRQGYTKAILNFENILSYVECDMKEHNKKLTTKYLHKLVKCWKENRADIFDNPDSKDIFIRYNVQKDDFELFNRNKQEKHN